MTGSVTLGILFSTVVRTAVVANPVILGIWPLTSIILALAEALAAKLVILRILSSVFLILVLYTSFLTKSFLLYHLVYLNQQEQILIYQYLIYLLYTFKIAQISWCIF